MALGFLPRSGEESAQVAVGEGGLLDLCLGRGVVNAGGWSATRPVEMPTRLGIAPGAAVDV
ncbi:MAG: hypothetical protein RML93_13275 [Anaerolineales bacterium]|nr:hypothetical protein [Anaerolineales bacterium]MDW8448244.1 hypothetical protein [Anaerolineales bacterium]